MNISKIQFGEEESNHVELLTTSAFFTITIIFDDLLMKAPSDNMIGMSEK